MQELVQRVEELRMENDYQLRLKDMNYNDKIKELTEKFIQEMESLKTKNQVLKTDKDKEEAKHEEKTAELMEKQINETRELGTSDISLDTLNPNHFIILCKNCHGTRYSFFFFFTQPRFS